MRIITNIKHRPVDLTPLVFSALQLLKVDKPGCISCFCHAENKFDKSVSLPTLHQPPVLYSLLV